MPLRLFRRYSATYGTVPSWWDWQETTRREWGALGAKIGNRPLPAVDAEVEYPLLKIGAKGDLVVWAQERLVTAGQEIEVNGIFNRTMRRAVRAFQEAHGLPGDGQLGSETWVQLMNYTPTAVELGRDRLDRELPDVSAPLRAVSPPPPAPRSRRRCPRCGELRRSAAVARFLIRP